jgi:Calx-beta domain
VDGGVDTIWASARRVFAAGSFTTVGGLDQVGFASFSEPAELRIDDVKITEGDTGTKRLRFRVRLSRSDEETVAVGFATQNGSAHSPGDFAFAKGQLVFLPGQKAKTVAVRVRGDKRSEGNETFFLRLGDPTNATVGDGSGKATIVDDD